jgi:hypothetical protein
MRGDEDKALMLSCRSHLPDEGGKMTPQMPGRTSAVQGLKSASRRPTSWFCTYRDGSTHSRLRGCLTACGKFSKDAGREMCDLLLVEFVVCATFRGAVPPVPALNVPLPMSLASICKPRFWWLARRNPRAAGDQRRGGRTSAIKFPVFWRRRTVGIVTPEFLVLLMSTHVTFAVSRSVETSQTVSADVRSVQVE